MKRFVVGRCWLLACVLAWGAAAGCSRPPPPLKQEDPAVVNMRKIVQAYDVAEYRLRHPPRNEEELTRFFGEINAKGPSDQYLRSPRDGQPYVILYGARLDPSGQGVILAYEKTGAEGNRYVMMLSRDVKLMTNEEFAAAEFAQGGDPSGK